MLMFSYEISSTHFSIFPGFQFVFSELDIVTCMSLTQRSFALDIGFIDHLRIVTTSDYNSLMELHTPNITVTTAHIKSSLHSLTFN
jgi:hypothetical protein